MDIRNVQRTGNMHYIYLPTSWVKKNHLSAASKVELSQDSAGNLSISPIVSEIIITASNNEPYWNGFKFLGSDSAVLNENDMDIINKLIVGCYINPANSFKISLEKELDFNRLLDQKKLISLESVELDQKTIRCESAISISDPASLLKTMVMKIKNMIFVMTKSYNLELINRYEEEIDRSKLLIDKAVISALTFGKPKLKNIDMYYISLIAKDLERIADHLICIDKSETKFLSSVLNCMGFLKEVIENLEVKDNRHYLSHKIATEFIKRVNKIKEEDSRDIKTYDMKRIKHTLNNISEVLINWAITKEVDKK